jgi:hypothetical protein
MSEPVRESSSSRWRIWAAAGVGLLVLFLLFLAAGGDHSGPDPNAAGTADDASRAETELRRQLSETLDGLRPERVSVSVTLDGQVDDLNLWWVDYSESVGASIPADSVAAVSGWLGDEAAQRAAANRFDVRDAAHIRDALMFRAIAESVALSSENELQRTVNAFTFVTRHVSLVNRTAADPPLTAFDVLLLGRGNAAERAWAFVEILRQLEIDAAILQPSADGGTGLLVGAILPGSGVHLFDPEIGLPVPAAASGTAILPEQPATLRDALADDGILRQFDIPGGRAYGWTAETLASAKVLFVTTAEWSAPRMQIVQAALPEEYASILHDGVVASESGRQPLNERIAAAGEDGLWSGEQLQAWPFAEEQAAAFFAAGGEEGSAVQQQFRIVRGPRVLRKQIIDGQDVIVETDSPEPLRFVRVLHMRGEWQDALTAYGTIRSAPLQLGHTNVLVREDAVYWIAVCQFELGRYDAAVSTLVLYLRDYPTGSWVRSSLELLALCEMHRGRPEAAVEVLQTSAGETPTLRESFLIRRWQLTATSPSGATE